MCVYCKHGKCVLLDIGSCNGDVSCSFKMDEETLVESKDRSYARIRGLSKKQRNDISEKYYGGRKPWEK